MCNSCGRTTEKEELEKEEKTRLEKKRKGEKGEFIVVTHILFRMCSCDSCGRSEALQR